MIASFYTRKVTGRYTNGATRLSLTEYPRYPVTGDAIVSCELPAGPDIEVGRSGDVPNPIVETCSGNKRHIDAPVVIETRDAILRAAVKRRESAGNGNFVA